MSTTRHTIHFQGLYQVATPGERGYVPGKVLDNEEGSYHGSTQRVNMIASARRRANGWHRVSAEAAARTVVEVGEADGWAYTVVRIEDGPDRGAFRISRTRITDAQTGEVIYYRHPIPAPEPLPEVDLSRFGPVEDADHADDCLFCAAGEGSAHAYEPPRDLHPGDDPMSTPATTYKGKPVTTWADGYGRWHARVDFPDSGYGNAGDLDLDRHWASIRAAARRAIRGEVLARESGPIGPVRIEVVAVDQSPSTMVNYSATFAEVTR